MKKLILPLLIAAALAGCSSFPANYDKPLQTQDAVSGMKDSWSALPAVSYIQSNTGVLVRKYHELPEAVANRPVKLAFKQGVAVSVDDLIYALRSDGYKVVNRLKESAKLGLQTTEFSGSLGELLTELTAEHNIAFEYRNGVIFLTETNRYAVSLPQHQTFMAQVAEAMKALGAVDTRVDVNAGMVYYFAKPDVADYLGEYLASVANNSAMVTLQVAVLTLGSHRDVSLGFDWAALMLQGGTGGFAPGLASAGAGAVVGAVPGVVGGVAGALTGGAATAAVSKIGSLLAMDGNGVGLKIGSPNFSLTAAIKAMSNYGNARTDQNVTLGTLNGLPVKISSGNDIPYIKNIGSSTAAGGATAGSTSADIIKSGLKLEVTPNFDASDGSVVTQVKVDLSTLVGFRELSAGAQLGTLSQPEMQNLAFENVGRIKAGETIVLGGITYDQLTKNYTNLPGMEDQATGSKSEKTSRNSIYIVVRPTVVIFTPKANELNAQRARASAPAPVRSSGEAQVVPAVMVVEPIEEFVQ